MPITRALMVTPSARLERFLDRGRLSPGAHLRLEIVRGLALTGGISRSHRFPSFAEAFGIRSLALPLATPDPERHDLITAGLIAGDSAGGRVSIGVFHRKIAGTIVLDSAGSPGIRPWPTSGAAVGHAAECPGRPRSGSGAFSRSATPTTSLRERCRQAPRPRLEHHRRSLSERPPIGGHLRLRPASVAVTSLRTTARHCRSDTISSSPRTAGFRPAAAWTSSSLPGSATPSST